MEAVTIVTPDCYQFNEATLVSPPEWNGSRVLMLPTCLTGAEDASVDVKIKLLEEMLESAKKDISDVVLKLIDSYELRCYYFEVCARASV